MALNKPLKCFRWHLWCRRIKLHLSRKSLLVHVLCSQYVLTQTVGKGLLVLTCFLISWPYLTLSRSVRKQKAWIIQHEFGSTSQYSGHMYDVFYGTEDELFKIDVTLLSELFWKVILSFNSPIKASFVWTSTPYTAPQTIYQSLVGLVTRTAARYVGISSDTVWLAPSKKLSSPFLSSVIGGYANCSVCVSLRLFDHLLEKCVYYDGGGVRDPHLRRILRCAEL